MVGLKVLRVAGSDAPPPSCVSFSTRENRIGGT